MSRLRTTDVVDGAPGIKQFVDEIAVQRRQKCVRGVSRITRGERGRSIHPSNSRIALQRLARGRYVIARTGEAGLVNYRLAKRGADAVAEHE